MGEQIPLKIIYATKHGGRELVELRSATGLSNIYVGAQEGHDAPHWLPGHREHVGAAWTEATPLVALAPKLHRGRVGRIERLSREVANT
ncbi:hypothetical protein NDU88_008183 [Pleurodeles waltl]|uniref:Uncharacterized protein n=1 Tax=Pleurodeles waltl TaxID=8319 RepID=A0AAV7VWG3_PLEWA|nr:hypothetical protein NDU88_008183 [Pleurodeles waltl]